MSLLSSIVQLLSCMAGFICTCIDLSDFNDVATMMYPRQFRDYFRDLQEEFTDGVYNYYTKVWMNH